MFLNSPMPSSSSVVTSQPSPTRETRQPTRLGEKREKSRRRKERLSSGGRSAFCCSPIFSPRSSIGDGRMGDDVGDDLLGDVGGASLGWGRAGQDAVCQDGLDEGLDVVGDDVIAPLDEGERL